MILNVNVAGLEVWVF